MLPYRREDSQLTMTRKNESLVFFSNIYIYTYVHTRTVSPEAIRQNREGERSGQTTGRKQSKRMSENRHDVCIWQRPFSEYSFRQSACHVAADQFSHDQTPRERKKPLRQLNMSFSFACVALELQSVFFASDYLRIFFLSLLHLYITRWSKI